MSVADTAAADKVRCRQAVINSLAPTTREGPFGAQRVAAQPARGIHDRLHQSPKRRPRRCDEHRSGPSRTDEEFDMTQPSTRKPAAPHTCGGCPATWTGTSPCHCSGCHVTFSGINLFDTHRRILRGTDTCIDPAAIVIAGEPLRLVDGVWRAPEMTDEARAKLAS